MNTTDMHILLTTEQVPTTSGDASAMNYANVSVRERGQIVLIVLLAAAAILVTFAGFINHMTLYAKVQRQSGLSLQALALAEAGVDTAAYSLNVDPSYTGEIDTPLGDGTFSVSVATINESTKRITSIGYIPNNTSPRAAKTVKTTLNINTSIVSFRFGIQIGEGGLSMKNGSLVRGNVFSNGTISGSGTIENDATVAGTTTSLSGVDVGGDVWAHALSNCLIGGSAKYQMISSCSVGGMHYPGSTAASAGSFPISAAQIMEWETTAEGDDVIAGSYSVSGTVTLGPKKINGDLSFQNGAVLELSGPVWVNGDITIANNAGLRVSAETGGSGAILIADATGYTATKGKVYLSNNVTVSGNGTPGSTPMILSTNTGTAIDLNNNAASIILYAPYGTVHVNNGAQASQITAWRLELDNNAEVQYDTGLQSSSFSNGPGGSWAFVPGSYVIAQ